MFGIDGTEFLVIILVAVVVIGPKDMPKMLRAFAQATARMRALAQEFRGHFDEAVRQADMQETVDSLRAVGDSVRGLDPRRKLQEFYASLENETALEREQRLRAENFAEQAEPIAAEPAGAAFAPGREALPPAEPVGDVSLYDAALNSGGGDSPDLDQAAACAVEGRVFAPLSSLPRPAAAEESAPAAAAKSAAARAVGQESRA